MEATERWRELMGHRDEALALDETALLIAAHANPELDIDQQLRRLDALAEQVPDSSVDQLCVCLFETFGLSGDRTTYDDPRNSFVDQVLDRRLGIPISLSVVMIEVGRRCGMHLEGVGMPGHFLVRDPNVPDEHIDAFTAGRRLDRHACEQLMQSVVGPGVALTAEMLAPCPTRTILARMLGNLDQSYLQRSDRRSLVWTTRLRAMIPGLPMETRITLAERFANLGSFGEAADLLIELSTDPGLDDEEAQRLEAQARAWQARLN